jgi:prolyl-tRNA synthetase
MLYGPTNEELITAIFRDGVKSYKDLPRILYHIQWKFRDEIRPRFGVMRGSEFLMNDSYSFDLTLEDARISYNKMFVSYLRTFNRMGLKSIPMAAESGPIGGDMSHEFIILADTGESEVYCHRDLVKLDPPGVDLDYDSDLSPVVEAFTGKYAATSEKHDAAGFAKEVPEADRVTARGIEVGHIFFFGTKYSEPMGCKVQGPDGGLVAVQMGSYGIGVSRLVGGIIEASHDESGIIWPDAVAEQAYKALTDLGKEPLLDDRDDRPGAKFASLDLVGVPWQLIVGPKGVADGVVEIKRRATGERQTLPLDAAIQAICA